MVSIFISVEISNSPEMHTRNDEKMGGVEKRSGGEGREGSVILILPCVCTNKMTMTSADLHVVTFEVFCDYDHVALARESGRHSILDGIPQFCYVTSRGDEGLYGS